MPPIVAPLPRKQRQCQRVRAGAVLASAAVAAVVIVAVSRERPAARALLGSPVRPQLDSACSSCLSTILRDNAPWAVDPSFDPKDASLCVVASCKGSTLQSRPASATQQLSGLPEGMRARPSKTQQLALLSKEQHRLDTQQLELNWKRARVFARFMGAPGKSTKMVLADWVPPLDPRGRPVPSWLKFVPAGAAGTSGLFGTNGAWDPEAEDPTKQQSPAVMANNTLCYAQDTCATCVQSGCAWCHGAAVCGTSCPALSNVRLYTSLSTCPVALTAQEVEQENDEKELRDLTLMSGRSEVGTELLKNISAEEHKYVKAADVMVTFYPLAHLPLFHGIDDPGLSKSVQEAAASNGNKLSLQEALAPLNLEQESLNAKRQMLFFRTETGVAPGLEHSIYDPTVGGGGSWDNWAKPTTTWSLVGRPAPGWLHWGNDNDGGYFNPVGGSQWDPQILDPAEEKGAYGPATNAYRQKHPHPEDEPSAIMVGSPLFGT
jgi:hypothetical protein